MTNLFERLQSAARPYEVRVGEILTTENWHPIPSQSMDYDVLLYNPLEDKHLKVEVKVQEGCNKNKKPYDTACIEIKEYQYRHDDYVWSHWLTAPFDIMVHYNKFNDTAYLFNGQIHRSWAWGKRHNRRRSFQVKTEYIKSGWTDVNAGFFMSIPYKPTTNRKKTSAINVGRLHEPISDT